MVFDGTVEDGREVVNFMQAIIAMLEGEVAVEFPAAQRRDGAGTLTGVRAALDILLRDPGVDVVLAMDPVASHDLAHRTHLPKPAIALQVVDMDLQGLPYQQGTSGISNLTYVVAPGYFFDALSGLHALVPFKRLAMFVDSRLLDLLPELPERAERQAALLGVAIDVLPLASDTTATLAALPETADAVLLAPARLPRPFLSGLAEGIRARHLPGFTLNGRKDVAAGLMAGFTSDSLASKTPRVASVLRRIAAGENAGTLPVTHTGPWRPTVNLTTIVEVGTWPDREALAAAERLNDPSERGRHLTLAGAVEQAVTANLALRAGLSTLNAGAARVEEVRAPLHPQLTTGGRGVVIDSDRAEAAAGLQPEVSVQGVTTLSQILYDEQARAELDQEKDLHRGRHASYDTLRLDIATEAATRYLEVLRAETVVAVREQDLERSLRHRSLATERQATGLAEGSETFRWERETATSQTRLEEARSRAKQARIELVRVLHAPLEEPFTTVESGLDDPALLVSDPRFLRFLDTERGFETFRDFMIIEGVARTPELRRLEADVQAARRAVRAAERAFFLPTVEMDGNLVGTGARSGAGTQPLAQDDWDWTVQVAARFPILTGGERTATLRRAREELKARELLRDAGEEAVEARIRAATHQAGFSLAAIPLSRKAAQAARLALERTDDDYERGDARLVDLVDAQNATLTSELEAAQAVYASLIDLLQLQRAAGQSDFFLSQNQREGWFQRLETFFSDEGVSPPPAP